MMLPSRQYHARVKEPFSRTLEVKAILLIRRRDESRVLDILKGRQTVSERNRRH